MTRQSLEFRREKPDPLDCTICVFCSLCAAAGVNLAAALFCLRQGATTILKVKHSADQRPVRNLEERDDRIDLRSEQRSAKFRGLRSARQCQQRDAAGADGKRLGRYRLLLSGPRRFAQQRQWQFELLPGARSERHRALPDRRHVRRSEVFDYQRGVQEGRSQFSQGRFFQRQHRFFAFSHRLAFLDEQRQRGIHAAVGHERQRQCAGQQQRLYFRRTDHHRHRWRWQVRLLGDLRFLPVPAEHVGQGRFRQRHRCQQRRIDRRHRHISGCAVRLHVDLADFERGHRRGQRSHRRSDAELERSGSGDQHHAGQSGRRRTRLAHCQCADHRRHDPGGDRHGQARVGRYARRRDQ